MSSSSVILSVKNLEFYYGDKKVLKKISMEINRNSVTALIGPSGCGKTTYLRCFNRMHDLYPNTSYGGSIQFNGKNLFGEAFELTNLRNLIGMVFQKPAPFPMSIIENIAYGLRLKGIENMTEIQDRAEKSLKQAALWDEVKDRLEENSSSLSGGQQQRLVIARALAVEPEVLLFDEPTSALDPSSTSKVEELLGELKEDVTIIIVTHNMQQAARTADYTAFMYEGELIEYNKTDSIFNTPENSLTEDYISGRFG
nr:phosphate ABC transporter ATP-binding protein PstB [Limisalsivibrio acetivorans]